MPCLALYRPIPSRVSLVDPSFFCFPCCEDAYQATDTVCPLSTPLSLSLPPSLRLLLSVGMPHHTTGASVDGTSLCC
jgi:hypothetical protein